MAQELQQVEVVRLEAHERYSDQGFWQKMARFAKRAGREVVEKALWLYYALQRPETPLWAKRVIVGALAYFILPFDFISDLLPGIGFTDDLGVIMAALSTVAMYITPAVQEQARKKVIEWFGELDTPQATQG